MLSPRGWVLALANIVTLIQKKEFTLNPFKEHSVNSFTLKELEKYVPNVKGIEITNRKTWEQYGTKEEK